MGKASRERRRQEARAAAPPSTTPARQPAVKRSAAGSAPASSSKEHLLDLLRRQRRVRERLDADRDRLVVDARRQGATWTEIGAVLGVSAQAVAKKYGGRRSRD